MTIQMEATKQHFSMAMLVSLFLTLYSVVLTFESMNDALKCENSMYANMHSSTFRAFLVLICDSVDKTHESYRRDSPIAKPVG